MCKHFLTSTPGIWFQCIGLLVVGSLVLFGGACTPSISPQTEPFAANLGDREILITGHDYQWRVRYPGPDGEFGTADDLGEKRRVHVPLGVKTTVRLTSDDFIYTFALPHLGLKEIAVPDLEFSLEFVPDAVGEFQLLGDQMCGYAHEDLLGTLVVQSPEDFLKWQAGAREVQD